MLAAQKFAMTSCWHHDDHQSTSISCNFPVTYADRVRMLHKSFRGSNPRLRKATPPRTFNARLGADGDGQWETNEHNAQHSRRAGIYQKVWSGGWEDFDPWNGSTRANRTSDEYENSNKSQTFKMFQGVLPLSLELSDDDPSMRLCTLPLRLTTAYLLLRPLFSPKRPLVDKKEDFLDPVNWALNSQGSAQRSVNRVTEPRFPLEFDDTFYPHLQLEQTLIELPPVNPGDYVIWHPDTVYAPPSTCSEPNTPSCSPATPPTPSTLLYIPACPLTLNNAKYLVHQRKAFLLGYPGPDFTSSTSSTHDGPNNERPAEIGESYHMGRPGVQEINDAGGEEALRAMGLLAWDEDDAADAGEKVLLKRANALLFPDRAALR